MEYRAKMTILTGQPIEREDLGRFVIDFETLKFHKDRFSVDFNHDDEIPLGYIENIHFEEGVGLVGFATLSAPIENDKASEIISRLQDNFPFEVSPTLELDFSSALTLGAGETKEVNGNEVNGEVDIYYNTQFRGCGVVLFGTDPNTTITALKQTNLITLNTKQLQNNEDNNMAKNKETVTETNLEAPVTEAPVEEKKPEYLALLEGMIESFGEETALRYFRQGLSMEEAEKADYAELKEMRAELACGKKKLAEGGMKEDEPTESTNASTGEGDGGRGQGEGQTGQEQGQGGGQTPAPETAPERTGEKEKEALKAELSELKAELTKLRSAISSRGESAPVSTSPAKTSPDNLDPIHKMANKIKNNGIKKR